MTTGKTNIQISRMTREILISLGQKTDTFDDIICNIIHQRNVFFIHELCRGQFVDDDLKERCRSVFQVIKFEIVPPFLDNGLSGTGEYVEWESFDKALDWAVEMATDEDMIGHNREDLPLGEVITNIYCLMNNIPSPTTTGGLRRNPFSI